MHHLWIALAAAADGAPLAAAMDVPDADLTSAVVTGDTDAYGALDALGVFVPFTGEDLVVISTGEAGTMFPEPGEDLGAVGATGDQVTLDLALVPPADAARFEVKVNFLSSEYPEFVGTRYNDRFNVNVTSPLFTGDAGRDDDGNPISVNSAFFGLTSAEDLAGTGFDAAGYSSYYYDDVSGLVGAGTGWITLAVPVTPLEPFTVVFVVKDVGDGSYDSVGLIDDWRWSSVPLDEPEIIAPPALEWLSPKRGPIAGGTVTELRGRNFDGTCFAVIGGVVADDTEFVDAHHLRLTTPPHAVGPVDVRVDCEDGEASLGGAFTYYDEAPDGVDEVRILEIAPWTVPAAGGPTVELTVEGLAAGATVLVDGEAVDVTEVDATHVAFAAPPRDPGVADVEVRLPDGRFDVREGGLFYLSDTPRTDTDGGDDGPAADAGCGCATGASTAGAPLAALLLLASRRRR